VRGYRSGANFERELKHELEGIGYYVIRSAGSHGQADLVALKRGVPPILIQCKLSNWTNAEREQLEEAASYLGAIWIMARREQGGRYVLFTGRGVTMTIWLERKDSLDERKKKFEGIVRFANAGLRAEDRRMGVGSVEDGVVGSTANDARSSDHGAQDQESWRPSFSRIATAGRDQRAPAKHRGIAPRGVRR
jgi:hypothetical protein